MNLKNTAVLVVALGLAGCASTPPPIATKAQVDNLAKLSYQVERCVQEGKMSPEIGVAGMELTNKGINSFAYASSRVQSAKHGFAYDNKDKELPASICNSLAMSIVANTPKPAPVVQTPVVPVYNAPMRTYCIRIGPQTMCNTY